MRHEEVEGEWIHENIVVHGMKAALYLVDSTQPCLLINDLKLGSAQGAIAFGGIRHHRLFRQSQDP